MTPLLLKLPVISGIANLISLVRFSNKDSISFENWRHIITSALQSNGRPYNVLLCNVCKLSHEGEKHMVAKLAFDMNSLKNKTNKEAINEASTKARELQQHLKKSNQSFENIDSQAYYKDFGVWINPEFLF